MIEAEAVGRVEDVEAIMMAVVAEVPVHQATTKILIFLPWQKPLEKYNISVVESVDEDAAIEVCYYTCTIDFH